MLRGPTQTGFATDMPAANHVQRSRPLHLQSRLPVPHLHHEIWGRAKDELKALWGSHRNCNANLGSGGNNESPLGSAGQLDPRSILQASVASPTCLAL